MTYKTDKIKSQLKCLKSKIALKCKKKNNLSIGML